MDGEIEIEITPPHEEKTVTSLNIEVMTHKNKVVINFGQTVRWIGIDRDTALSMAEALIHHAREVT